MSATPSLPAAFKIVRQLLQQGPRPFQEILRDGIAAVPSSSKLAATSAQAATSTAAIKGKGKKNGVAQPKSANIKPSVVPSDHPFISANYLKTRILPILHSQNLIHKTSISQPPGAQPLTPEERAQSLHERHLSNSKSRQTLDARGQPIAAKPVWVWRLVPPMPETASSAQAGLMWDTESHWDRLCSGEGEPSQLAYELKQVELARDAVRQEQMVTEGKRRRTEREIMALPAEERETGVTTRLERLYLNKRRGLARPAKERKVMAALVDLAEARRVGEEEAQSHLAL